MNARGTSRAHFARAARRLGVAAALLACAAASRAADVPASVLAGQSVARSAACMGCHAVDRKLVGPSFRQIAARYKGDKTAPAKLALKVKNGGVGVWGAIPMPSHPGMSDADVQTVVAWVLAGAPTSSSASP